jgi:hypothetical protein
MEPKKFEAVKLARKSVPSSASNPLTPSNQFATHLPSTYKGVAEAFGDSWSKIFPAVEPLNRGLTPEPIR